MFRLVFRLVVLALTAVGAKALYDLFARHSEEVKSTGADSIDGAGAAARAVGTTVTEAAQKVGATAKGGASDVKATAQDKAAEVKDAASNVMDKATSQLEPETAPAGNGNSHSS